jgi:hypothetical protein
MARVTPGSEYHGQAVKTLEWFPGSRDRARRCFRRPRHLIEGCDGFPSARQRAIEPSYDVAKP